MKYISFFILSAFIFIACNNEKEVRARVTGDPYIDAISHNDVKLKTPVSGEWRFTHKEKYQSFSDYQKMDPKKAQPGITRLYLQPIGKFTAEQEKLLESSREYLEIFFQLSTILLPAVSDANIPDTAKRTRVDGTQLYTPYLFSHFLSGKIPDGGYALMAITEKDIYPNPDWNFVFGIASYVNRIGVTSIYRLQSNVKDSITNILCLRRLATIASHEIGHMFSMHHCVYAECAMNGSNSMRETDRCVSRLCSECQQKLNWSIGYNNKIRLEQLIAYFKKNKMNEDLVLAEKDYNLVE